MNLERAVITIGSFDGVHCGHQMLLRRVVDLATQYHLRSVVLTFWPHPRQVIDPDGEAPHLLNTLDEKIALLERTGIDNVVVCPFDKALSQMQAPDFIEQIVVGKLHAQCLVVGTDHHFGKGRNGDVRCLREFATHNDLKIEVVNLKMLNQKISSSAIREALLYGQLSLANEMLGYEYRLSGKVIAGNRLGRTIGFPTANIEPPNYKLLPSEGVYRVKVRIDADESERIGMMYIGKRPVLKQPDTTTHIEVNIFDFDREIYGQKITLTVTHRIRDNIYFSDIGQLFEQLCRDKQNTLNILS